MSREGYEMRIILEPIFIYYNRRDECENFDMYETRHGYISQLEGF